MKILKTVAIAAFTLASAGAYADFISDTGDGCSFNCDTLNERTDPNNIWVDPTGTELDGAAWIAPDSQWFVTSDNRWRVWEEDLAKNGSDNYISSLFVSYDDELQIRIAGNLIWSSDGKNINQPWTQIIDIISYTGQLYVGPNSRINFYVTNSGGGPTGVIWKGSTAVPEPGTLALLGLGLAGLGMSRRKKV